MQPPADIPDNVLASTVNQRIRFSAAYSVLQSAIADRAFPGAAFGVLLDGQTIALDALGRFTYDPDSRAVTATTAFDLASLTKVVATTAAAMLLYDRGKLELDQPLGDLLPSFVIGSFSSRERCRVTLRHLLAHASGLPRYARLFAQFRTREELLRACLQLPLEAAPGARAEYSDPGFILLGKAIEVLLAEPLDRFCHREIFAPLGMTSTRFRPPDGWRALIPSTEQDLVFRQRVIQGEVQDENCFVLGGVSGHAGLFAHGLDLLRFAGSILDSAKPGKSPGLFHSETIALFSSRQELPPGSSRALGWDTPSPPSSAGTHFSPGSIGHLGYAGTSLWIDLDRRLAIVLLTNRTWPDRSSQLIRSVRPAFHDAVFAALTFT